MNKYKQGEKFPDPMIKPSSSLWSGNAHPIELPMWRHIRFLVLFSHKKNHFSIKLHIY